MKSWFIFSLMLLLILFSASVARANIILPAVANQFAVSFVVSFYWSVLLALAILSIETLFIRNCLSIKIAASFFVSFLLNFASSVAGVFIMSMTFVIPVFQYENMRLGTYLGMVPGYLLTVLLEGIILLLIVWIFRKKKTAAGVMKVTAIMNFFSYLLILTGVLLADVLTGGKNFQYW